MPVLFASNELEGFEIPGVEGVFNRTVFTPAAEEQDPDYCRVGMAVTSIAELIAKLPTPQTDFWVHFEVSFLNRVAGTGGAFVQLVDGATGQVVVQLDFDAGTECVLEYWDGAALTELAGSQLFDDFANDGDRYAIDIHCKIDNSAGRFAWYVNGSFIAEFTGDTLNTGFTSVDRIKLRNPNTASTTSTTSNVYSQVIVATQSTIGWKLGTLYPDGAGTYTTWDGAYTEVDQNGIDDTDFISGDAVGEKEYVTVSAPPSTAGYQIVAVVVSARAVRNGARSMSLDCRAGGSDGLGDFFTPDAGVVPYPYRQIFYVNPATNAGWVGSDLTALEIGVNVRA